MSLNDLDQPQLERLIDALLKVGEATQPLHRDGLNPRIDLTPGEQIVITLGFAMPDLDVVIEDLFAHHQTPTIPSPEAAPDLTQPGEADPARSEPGETPPAVGDSAGGNPLSAAPEADADDAAPSGAIASVSLATAASDAEGVAEGGGGAVMAAAIPPAASAAPPDPAPVPGSASALAANAGKLRWTEEEDDRLVAYIVEAVTVRGLTKAAAIPLAAAELGRPAPGTEFRANRALKDRINGAIFAAATRQAQTETPEIPASDTPLVADGDAAIGGDASGEAPTPVPEKAWDKPSHIADPLTAHLMALPQKDGWTLARDLDLMELTVASWPSNEIGLELKVRADLVKARFDLLTGLYTDANGKKCRRFPRKAVLDALQALNAANAKAGAA